MCCSPRGWTLEMMAESNLVSLRRPAKAPKKAQVSPRSLCLCLCLCMRLRTYTIAPLPIFSLASTLPLALSRPAAFSMRLSRRCLSPKEHGSELRSNSAPPIQAQACFTSLSSKRLPTRTTSESAATPTRSHRRTVRSGAYARHRLPETHSPKVRSKYFR